LYVQWFRQAEKVASDNGFIAYNHEVEIRKRLRNQSLIINRLDGHPSASVNRVYGEKLYRVIAKQFASKS
jgi:hypothetical protein